MKFAYKGINRDRRKVQGVVDAQDAIEAKMKLRALQVRPTHLSLAKIKKKSSIMLSWEDIKNFDFSSLNEITFGPVVSLREMLIFIRQFSCLIDAGVPVVQGLTLISEQIKNKNFKKVLLGVREELENGNTLARSMGHFPKVFPEIMVSLIESGEISGTLDYTLKRIAVQLEKTETLRRKIKGAMLYPGITLFFAVVVVGFLLLRVIPDVSQMYQDSQAQLPGITLAVLAFSHWTAQYFNHLILSVVLFGFASVFLAKNNTFRLHWDPFILRVPLIGDLILRTSIARISRTFSVLVGSGVPLLNAFTIVNKLVSNKAIKKIINDTAMFVSEGKSLAYGFSRQNLLPPMVIQMVSIGEVSGRLDELMAKIADIYEEEVDDVVETFSTILQPPLLIAGVGSIILFLLVAMYLPIFQLADKISGA